MQLIVRDSSLLPTSLIGTEFAFDTETSGLIYPLTVVGISLANAKDSWYIPIIDADQKPDFTQTLKFLNDLFNNSESIAIGHNAKFDIKSLASLGINVTCSIIDTLLASWLLDERGEHGLKPLSRKILRLNPPELKFTKKINASDYAMNRIISPSKAKIPTEQFLLFPEAVHPYNLDLAVYAMADAENTFKLWNWWFKHQLKGFSAVYESLDMPYQKVLIDMELTGAQLDIDLLTKYNTSINSRIPTFISDLQEIAGRQINPNSTTQIAEVIYDTLGYDCNTWTPTGKRGVAKSFLASCKHEFVQTLLKYRGVKKLQSTYIEPLLRYAYNGRMYGNFNQTGTLTGRLSSSEPINL